MLPQLRHLQSFSWQIPECWEHAGNFVRHPDGFATFAEQMCKVHNLRSLSFLRVRGFTKLWEQLICTMLMGNNGIQHFALSTHNHDVGPTANALTKHRMMSESCANYLAVTQQRLKLTSLHLGPRLDTPREAAFCYDTLKEIYFYKTDLEKDRDDPRRPYPRHWTEGEPISMLSESRTAYTQSSKRSLFRVLKRLAASGERVKDWKSPCSCRLPLRHGPRSGFEMPVLELPVCHEIMASILDNDDLSWITHVVFQLRLPLVSSQDTDLPTAWFCVQTLAEVMPNLRAIWVHGMIDNDHSAFQAAIADDLSRQRRAVWLAMLSPSLKYVRLDTCAWRVRRPGPNGIPFALEGLDEWEDELEGPEVFHAPQTKLGSWQLNHTYR